MDQIVTVLVTLVLISAMIAVILAIAWRDFGRPRHAFTWSLTFTLWAIAWALLIVLTLWWHNAILMIATSALSVFASAGVAIGFRQRSGSGSLTRPLLASGGAVTVIVAVLDTIGRLPGVAAALPVLYATVANAIAAGTLTGRRASERAAERTAMVVLVLIAGFHLVTAAMALGAVEGDPRLYLSVFLDARMLVLPAAMTGTGLFALFLLAADLADRMRQLAASDPLTGILNRRGFEEAAVPLLQSARSKGRPVSLAIADLDRFKHINDTRGHAAGDRVLQQFAEHVGRSVRPRDLFARTGGEEFVIVLPDTLAADAVARMETLRQDIARAAFDGLPPGGIAVSFGVTQFQAEDATVSGLLERADAALYRSKQDGRNRVTLG